VSWYTAATAVTMNVSQEWYWYESSMDQDQPSGMQCRRITSTRVVGCTLYRHVQWWCLRAVTVV
jgi:hypothetical protein